MNRTRYLRPIRCLASILAGLAAALLAAATATPAAFATRVPPPGTPPGPAPLPSGHLAGAILGPNRAGHPPVSHIHTVVVGGMPGWQIALIAAGAAVAAAALAVLLDRAQAAGAPRRTPGRAQPDAR